VVTPASNTESHRAPALGSSPAAGSQAALTLDVNGPTRINQGLPLTFDVVVKNSGAAGVREVEVEVPLPPGARLLRSEPPAEVRDGRLTWNLGDLPAGGQRRLVVEVQPPEAGSVLLRPLARFGAAEGLAVAVVRPPLALTVIGPESATTGGKVVFQIALSNNSNAPITNVLLYDPLPPGLRHEKGQSIEAPIAKLDPGQTRTLRLETDAVAPGRQVNEVTARADGGLTARARTAVLVREAFLSLALDGPRRAAVNGEVVLGLKLTNPSGTPAREVSLALAIPEGLEFVSASTAASFDPAGHVVRWALGTLEPGHPQLVTCKLHARLAGDWALPAACRAGGMGEVKSTHAVHLEALPALTLEMAPLQDPLDVGGETAYVVRVHNQGAAAAQALVLSASVPPELLPLRGDGASPGRVQGQQVQFAELAGLAPNVDAVFRVHVRGRQPGQGSFRVQLTAPALTAPLAQEVTAHVRTPAASAQ
jgi:uncharacterized repeat protein (TIGR01451 family)